MMALKCKRAALVCLLQVVVDMIAVVAAVCDCEGFCSRQCSLPMNATPPATIDVYRLTPYNITDLVNKNTGDVTVRTKSRISYDELLPLLRTCGITQFDLLSIFRDQWCLLRPVFIS